MQKKPLTSPPRKQTWVGTCMGSSSFQTCITTTYKFLQWKNIYCPPGDYVYLVKKKKLKKPLLIHVMCKYRELLLNRDTALYKVLQGMQS